MANFVAPSYVEVADYFVTKVGDPESAQRMTDRFFQFYSNNGWQIKVNKKLVPMKSWKGAINTWIRNLSKYNKSEVVKIKSKSLFNDEDL